MIQKSDLKHNTIKNSTEVAKNMKVGDFFVFFPSIILGDEYSNNIRRTTKDDNCFFIVFFESSTPKNLICTFQKVSEINTNNYKIFNRFTVNETENKISLSRTTVYSMLLDNILVPLNDIGDVG